MYRTHFIAASVAATYDDPELLRMDRSVVAPVSRVHGTKTQWRELLRGFDGADMLTLALELNRLRHRLLQLQKRRRLLPLDECCW